jgi:hypothetical protein
MHVGRTSLVSLAALCALVSSTATAADLFTDNFESYGAGTFPAANWFDTGTIAPIGLVAPPNPSCTVGVTTDAFGLPTQALHLDASWVGAASGIYRAVSSGTQYSLSMDVRTDAFATGSSYDPTDWPWMLGVSKYSATVHPGGWNSLMIYGTDLSQDFRAYAIKADATEEDLPLGLPMLAGVWYRAQIDVDSSIGSIRNRVWDSATSTLLLDSTVFASNWLPGDGMFDSVTINQGELSAMTSADAWVDNVSITVVPEPSTMLAGTLAALFMTAMRRRLSP